MDLNIVWLTGELVLYGFLFPNSSNTACTIKDLNTTHLCSVVNSDTVFKIKWICCNMFEGPVRTFCSREASVCMHAVPRVLKSHNVTGGTYKKCEERQHCSHHSDVANLCLKYLQNWHCSDSMYLLQLVPCASLWNFFLCLGLEALERKRMCEILLNSSLHNFFFCLFISFFLFVWCCLFFIKCEFIKRKRRR